MSSFNLATVIAVLFSAAAIPAGRPGSLWEDVVTYQGGEPSLADLISDPMTRRLMASDSVELDHLMGIVETARRRLRS